MSTIINEKKVTELVSFGAMSLTKLMNREDFVQQIEDVIEVCNNGLRNGGRIVFTGVGKNYYACLKLSATFASLNIPCQAFDVTHGLHGDLGYIKPNDVIIAFSKSGSTLELGKTLGYIKSNSEKFGNPQIIGVYMESGSKDMPDMHNYSNKIIAIPLMEELDNWNKVPTTSALALQFVGDIIAIKIAENQNFTLDEFVFTHPGGSIGETKI